MEWERKCDRCNKSLCALGEFLYDGSGLAGYLPECDRSYTIDLCRRCSEEISEIIHKWWDIKRNPKD